MRVLYNNLIWGSTLTNSNANINYPLDNIKNTTLAKYFRSANDNDFSTVIDTVTASACTYFAIMNHNFSVGATLTLEANATDVWTSPSFTTTLTYSADMILENFTSKTYRYWRLTISDNANVNGYIKIGSLYLSGHSQFPYMAPDQVFDYSSTSQKAFSDTGAMFVNIRYKYESQKINFPLVSIEDKASMLLVNDYIDYPIITIVYENDLTNIPALYSTIENNKITFSKTGNINLPFKTSFNMRQIL